MLAKRFFYVCAGLLCLALAYHLGGRSAAAQGTALPEVAVISGSYTPINEYALPALPTYRDGTTARLEDCRWIVSAGYINATRFGTSTPFVCEASGGGGRINVSMQPSDPNDMSRMNYLVIAIRSDAPTPATQETWGGVKARYRLEGTAKQAQDK